MHHVSGQFLEYGSEEAAVWSLQLLTGGLKNREADQTVEPSFTVPEQRGHGGRVADEVVDGHVVSCLHKRMS